MFSAIKKIFSKKEPKIVEFTYTTTKEPEIKDIGDDNSYDKFLNTLTPEQKKMNPLDFSDDLLYKNVLALYNMQTEAIPNSFDCSRKSLVLISNLLRQHNVKELNINIDFFGSKDGVETEKFNITFMDCSLLPPTQSIAENSVTLDDSDNGERKEPKKKINTLIEQEKNVIFLVEQLKPFFPNIKDQEGHYIVYVAACLLNIMETTSELNSADTVATLSNLIYKNVDTGVSYKATINRIEIDHPISLSSNKYKLT